jgi:F-type H+-transporting ATPase subunit b
MPQLDTTYYTSSVVWFLFCFGALFLFAQFWLMPKLNKLSDTRREEVKNKLEEISFLRNELAHLDAKYSSEIESIGIEAKQISQQILEGFKQEAAEILNGINKNCEAALQQGERKIQESFDLLLNDKESITSMLSEAFLSKSLNNKTEQSETC